MCLRETETRRETDTESDLKHLNVILPIFVFKELKFILPSLFFFLFFFFFFFFLAGGGGGILFICFCDNFLCHGSHVYEVFLGNTVVLLHGCESHHE